MKLFSIIREQLGVTSYKMAQKLDKPLNSYQYLEETATKVDLIDLGALYLESGMSEKEFVDLMLSERSRLVKIKKK